jgi:hypothetical protein
MSLLFVRLTQATRRIAAAQALLSRQRDEALLLQRHGLLGERAFTQSAISETEQLLINHREELRQLARESKNRIRRRRKIAAALRKLLCG